MHHSIRKNNSYWREAIGDVVQFVLASVVIKIRIRWFLL